MTDSGRKRRLEEDRRKEEHFALDLFLEALARPHGAPRRPKSGQPDFSVDIDGKEVGVELTEVVWPKRRQREEFAFKVVGEARALYESTGAPPLEVRFQFYDNRIPGEKDIPKRILDLVESLTPGSLPVHVWREVAPDQLEAKVPFIASMTALRKLDGRTNLWSITDAGTVLTLDSDVVQETIRRKQRALRALLNAPRFPLWLVIYTFDNRVSGSAELTAAAAAASYSTQFAKVFVLDAARKQVVELKTAR